MLGWNPQWYGFVPTCVKVKLNVSSSSKRFESNPVSSDVAVWGAPSLFVHTTVSPSFMVKDDGENLKFWMVTWWVCGEPELGAVF